MPGVFVPVPDVAEFTIVQLLHGQNVFNTFHVKKEGGWDSASMAVMAVEFIEWWNDALAPHLSADITGVMIRCRDLSEQAGAVAEINFPENSGGNSIVDALPGMVCMVCKHTTGVAGKSYRGRTYISGLPENADLDGGIAPQNAVIYTSVFDDLDARINTAGGTWGVVSRYSGYTQSPPKYKKVPTPRQVGIFTDIINNSVDTKLGGLSSRKLGRGQ